MTDVRDRWGAAPEMNELEATMWRAGRHPANSTQGGILQVFGATPEWDAVIRAHHNGIARFPRLRKRVVEPALPFGSPVWADDPGFDLDYHVRRVRLPEPGTREQLLALAQTLGSTPIDPKRPPWFSTFIEGLEDGRSAYFFTVHHCLMDGHSSIQLLSQLYMGTAEVAPGNGATSAGPNALQLAADQAADRLRGAPALAGRALGGLARAVRSGPRASARFAASIGRVLAPPSGTDTPLLDSGERSAWRYATLECGLDELKAAGKACGGTLNDAYVAGILGGLRLHHERAGVPLGDITATMPVSVRKPDDPEGGNRFVSAFIEVPSSEPDPRERIRRLRAAVSAIRGEPALDFFSLLLPVANRAPATLIAPLFNLMQDRGDLTISNVPGLPETVDFAGAPVESMHYFGPLPGTAVTTVLCSYAGRCHIGVTCDGQVFDDPHALARTLREGLDEVLSVAR